MWIAPLSVPNLSSFDDDMDYTNLHFVLAGPGHSGSTWLGHTLRSPNEIFVTHEINYLTWSHEVSALDPYFANAKGARILGEYSNNYFSWLGIPEQLSRLNPRLKIIIMVRDPVQKLISNYLHDLRWGILPRYITLKIAILPNYFERRYIYDSDYLLNIIHWLEYFPASQIYLFRSPADTGTATQVPDLLRFLGAQDHAAVSHIPAINRAILPLFPPMHRHATFGKSGFSK